MIITQIQINYRSKSWKIFGPKIILNNKGTVTTQAYRKNKLYHGFLKFPKDIKQDTISGNLHRSHKKVSDFDSDTRKSQENNYKKV